LNFDTTFTIDTTTPLAFDKLIGEPLNVTLLSVSADVRYQTPAFEFQVYLDSLLTQRHIKLETNRIGKHCEDGELDVSVTAPSLDLSFTLNTPLLSTEDADALQ
jgi:hypothetical protein